MSEVNPFNFSNWGNTEEHNSNEWFGGKGNGAFVQLGRKNGANPEDATQIQVHAAGNAAFIGYNGDKGDGAVGVFGTTAATTRGIGVAGQCSNGCGVFGISPKDGIGVAGRSMGGDDSEPHRLEKLFEAVGVLGISKNRAGVRGHGGPIFQLPDEGPSPPPVQAYPGGVFSSGQLSEGLIPAAEDRSKQEVSLDALAQLHLVPSTAATLPLQGKIGDLFVAAPGDHPLSLWLCVGIEATHRAKWRKVLLDLDNTVPGGTAVPA